ncbi:hypothetical protein [Persicobacter sp. CCB-QB2]|uniref:hypothetical protein n=1 Tax=Persicobacter sp. CCB-QB2 TaxID=1561025 RepID=UPI0006A95E0C|nr:hypothetical protein [Persicobacter sp. CCB-QB2]
MRSFLFFSCLFTFFISLNAVGQSYFHFDQHYRTKYPFFAKHETKKEVLTTNKAGKQAIQLYSKKELLYGHNALNGHLAPQNLTQLYFQKGDAPLQKASWENLQKALADERDMQEYFKKINRLKRTENGLLYSGIALVAVGIMHTATQTNAEGLQNINQPSPLLFAGAGVGLSSFIIKAIRKRKMKEAVHFYNRLP